MRALLADAQYSEVGLARALGADVLLLPRERGSVELAYRASRETPQHLLVRLFFAALDVPRQQAARVLGASALDALVETGLLAVDGATCRATAGLTPVGERLFAHDQRDAHRSGASDFVVGPGPATRHNVAFAIQRRVGSTLDLGCGQGVLGILAAAHSDHVTCVDLNPRAVAFCAFNAALNGAANVTCAQGDLYAPVAGRRFDLILCNPPYVVSPASTFVYRDGGGICERIVRETPAHLAPGGTLQMSCNWPHHRDRDTRAELAGWFEGAACDAWVLETARIDATAYAGVWLRQQHEDAGALAREFSQWVNFYEDRGIAAVSSGVVIMRAVSGRAPWFELRAVPAAAGACGEAIAQTLEARDFVARLPDERALLDAVLRLAPGAVLIARETSDGQGWTRARTELRLSEGLGLAASLDPVGAELVGYLDGARTARQAAEAFAAAHAQASDELLPQLPRLLRQLMGLGLVLPVQN